jgi:cellulose synthase (UDP-forming)
VRVFIKEVGFVAGVVARQSHGLVGVRFDLPLSLERDLLIRKLFTAGLDTPNVGASAWSSTREMFKSIWAIRTELPGEAQAASAVVIPMPAGKLPARSLVVAPQPQTRRLADFVKDRQSAA